LPVGAGFEDLETLRDGRAVGPVSALLLADSGYAPANPPEWVANLNPQVVLLSVSARDGQGRPSAETLEAIQGYNLLRTDRDGWIHLSTDGEQLWVEVERR
jgi:competence protein ComEC